MYAEDLLRPVYSRALCRQGRRSICPQPMYRESIRYDTIEEINVDSKAEYTA